MRILLVEDDEMIGEGLVKVLSAEGISVDWTRDGHDAEAVIRDPGYLLILLDLSLPGIDGLALLKSARAAGNSTPVLILTARDELNDRVSGLDLGADDYVCKPFEVRELLARMRALIRRRGGQASARLIAGAMELDTETRELVRNGAALPLPPREYALMLALMESPGRVLSRAQIEDRIYGWGEEIESNAIDYLIHSVRSKFDKAAILNVRGVGWMVAKL